MRFRILLPTLSLFMGVVCFGQNAPPPVADSSSLDFKAWGLVAIQDEGRRKPIDTFAREALIKMTGRSSYSAGGRTWEGADFILSLLLDTHNWKDEPMILVSLGELKQRLGLPGQQRRFSFSQLTALPELNALASQAHALRKAEKPLTRLQSEVMSVGERLTLFAHIMDGSAFLLVPAPQKTADAWLVPPAFAQFYSEEQFAPVQGQLQTMANAYTKGDGFGFSRAANQLRESLRQLSPNIYPSESQLRLEYFYNHWDGFYRGAWCYGVALVLLAIAHFRTRSAGAREAGRSYLKIAGVALAIAGLLFHSSGIVMRCLIAGRPPVTNMYESIIWVSFAVSFFGMMFFLRYRTPVYLLAALPVSLVALLLVHQMPIAMPSSIDPLVPVLRDNFWLTIHVLTITLSYAAFALAMGFGHILLFRYARNPI